MMENRLFIISSFCGHFRLFFSRELKVITNFEIESYIDFLYKNANEGDFIL